MVANILSFKPLSTFSSLLLFSLTEKKKNLAHQCHPICSPSAHQASRVVTVVFLELLFLLTWFFFPPFISFVRTGSLPSFTIVCFCQLYEETLFWLFLSIFLPESQHFVPLLFDGVFKNTLLFFLVWISVAECFCILVNSSNPKNSSAKFQNHKLSETGFLQLRLSYDLKTKPRVVKLT